MQNFSTISPKLCHSVKKKYIVAFSPFQDGIGVGCVLATLPELGSQNQKLVMSQNDLVLMTWSYLFLGLRTEAFTCFLVPNGSIYIGC